MSSNSQSSHKDQTRIQEDPASGAEADGDATCYIQDHKGTLAFASGFSGETHLSRKLMEGLPEIVYEYHGENFQRSRCSLMGLEIFLFALISRYITSSPPPPPLVGF